MFNSSWPKDTAAKDPGYALLTDDPWYDDLHPDYPDAKDWRKLYASGPPDDVFKAALSKYGSRTPRKTFSKTSRKTSSKTSSKKGTRSNDRRGSGLEKLELYEGRLVARNLETNNTRPLTDEEMDHQIEVVQCKDKQCSGELKISDTDLFIPMPAPPALPAINHDAVPTFTPTKSMRTEVRSQRRTNASPDLPAMTDMAAPET